MSIRIMTNEFCPECGGKLKVTVTGVSCLSCPFSKNGLSPKLMDKLILASEEIPEQIELSATGQFILETTKESNWLEKLLRVVRLVIVYSEGYTLKDLDRLELINSGLAREVSEEEGQESG